MPARPSIHALAPALLAAVALLAPSPAAAQGGAAYADVSAYPLDEARYNAWLELRIALRRGFDDICGDTFCEGDFSNIESLRFGCSVQQSSGRIGMCAWVFAASNEEIDPATGRIRITQRGFWRCRMPVAAGTRIEQLVDALQGDGPLYAPLPHSRRTLMDGLVDCL